MPYKPTSEMWATLLGACHIHGNTDIGEWAAEKLLEMKPQISGYYVLIANMYSSCCWLLEQTGKSKDWYEGLGCEEGSWMCLGGYGCWISPFLVEDTSQGQTNEIDIIL
ncbi:UNVERIFIED_CONTAM: Pentatricopeptide repeat-containing protein [Sesamum calycinum]|uniref:Pentatricopeptide repeat-containing protein n=2 Tax=Sesamum TaxID=4181 RepID=A0AAW2JAN9_9LAMI